MVAGNKSVSTEAGLPQEYLTFTLGSEEYAIDIRSAAGLLDGDFNRPTNETVSSLRLLRSRHEAAA